MKDLSNMMIKNPCPFVVKIFDCFITENNIYLVLEYCDDGDLSEDLDKRDMIPEA
jgi:calcium-dependent protein kinase